METKGLSESIYWKTKGMYISKPLNVVNGSQKVNNPDGSEIEKISSEDIVSDKPEMVKNNCKRLLRIVTK